MGINFFVYSLLIISTVCAFIEIEQNSEKKVLKEQAQIVFDNSTLYTLSEKNIDKIVNSSRVVRYKDRDVMYDGKIILRGEKKTTDYLESDIIVKRDSLYKFLNNVSFNRDNSILIKTDELIYDSTKNIAYNSASFNAIYNNNKLKGTDLYFDIDKSIIKANRAHFEVHTTN